YENKNILINYLQLICEHFGDINEINIILNYSLKLLYYSYVEDLNYGICYMILKNYKESQIKFERSIKSSSRIIATYGGYRSMLLQSSQFDKVNNLIQIIKNIEFRYPPVVPYELESEILIENGE